jgi:hypothetical protein
MSSRIATIALACACLFLGLELERMRPYWPLSLTITPPSRSDGSVSANTDDAMLDVVIPEITMDKLPLERAFDALTDRTSVNVVGDWPSFNYLNVQRTTPVTLHFRNVTLRQALNEISAYLETDMGNTQVDLNGVPLGDAFERLSALSGVRITVDRDRLISAKIDLAQPVYLHLKDVSLQSAFASLHLDEGAVAVGQNQGILVTLAPIPTARTVTYDVRSLIDRWQKSPYCAREPTTDTMADVSIADLTWEERASLARKLVEIISEKLQSSFGDNPSGVSPVLSLADMQLKVIATQPVQDAVQEFLRKAEQIDMSIK